MKILVVHNRYQQRGGEDTVFEAETRLLARNDCDVICHVDDNRKISEMAPISTALDTVWSRRSYSALRDLAREHRPDIVHFHNTFPLVSPAGYYAIKAEAVAIVQTLHNYRLLCPNALFLRNGAVCEDCLGRSVAWPAVKHRCYRDSRAASAVVATMLAVHHSIGTWTRKVDRFIVPTEFARAKFIAGGLTASKISVKPSFVYPETTVGSGAGNYALFVGRLAREKGIHTLIDAWRILGNRIPLLIVGDGPLSPMVEEAARNHSSIRYVGRKHKDEIMQLMGEATCLVFPSIWYEGGTPLTILESFAVGTPVIASRIGAMISMVEHRRTGLHFAPSDSDDLAAKVSWLFGHPAAHSDMRATARAEYKANYRAETNYEMLMQIYHSAIDSMKDSRQ
jgi:glycosyltransferase involved in cell wall biosynthesis